MVSYLSRVFLSQTGHPGAEHAAEDDGAVVGVVPHHVQRPIRLIPEILDS